MSRGKGHVPVRTCVSCGVKRIKKEMLRFVLSRDKRLVRDDSGRETGRGAYTCQVSSCIDALKNRKRLETVFRVSCEQRKKAG